MTCCIHLSLSEQILLTTVQNTYICFAYLAFIIQNIIHKIYTYYLIYLVRKSSTRKIFKLDSLSLGAGFFPMGNHQLIKFEEIRTLKTIL